MGFIRNGINAGGAIAYDYANVINIRSDVYKTKKEIIKTPLVRELVTATFSGNILPSKIWVNRDGVFARPYDEASCTYDPNGVIIYAPEVTFHYLFAAALLHIFTDLYPNAYEMNRVTTAELSQELQNGTWEVSLTLNDEHIGKAVCPAFDIFNIADTPLEALPLVLEDSYTKSTGSLGKVSLTFGIVAMVFSVSAPLLGGILAAVGIITAVISIITTKKEKTKDKKAIWGLVLSIASFVLPLLFGLLQIFAFFR